MKKLPWDAFTKKIHINASLDKLYWCWATQEGICAWFLQNATYTRDEKQLGVSDFLKPNDQYLWKWHNWDGKESGKIVDANGKNTVSFTFAGDCLVTVTLEEKDKVVLLTLTQSNIPLDEKSKMEIFYGCSNGWTFWLTNLKAYLEHGILLNETAIDLRGFDLAGYEFVNM
tara:strand:+ start:361298 stop:361810 length:513 start_codon:yes stop_codon:yes gene_type:complete